MTAPTIRRARESDVDTLVRLMSDVYAESGFSLPGDAAARAFASLLAAPQLGAVWIAEEDDAAVGYIVMTVVFSMEYGGLRGFIDDFYVRPIARGRGIGASLLRAVRDHAERQQLRALWVETGLADHPARPLYHRAGYVDTGHALLVQPLAAPVHEG